MVTNSHKICRKKNIDYSGAKGRQIFGAMNGNSCIESMPCTNSETNDKVDVPQTFSSVRHGLCILFEEVIFLAYPCLLFSDVAKPTNSPRDFQ